MNRRLANFPYDEETALTMLYLEKLDISDLNPTELVEEYLKIRKEIEEALSNNN
ncbi:hypothetical protein [Lysinibacillus fusiformis]|uniref:hypothetical protein n=1 Tax=Lysinibacillus fusiformis TaxID=28031 RepID=UPI0020C0499F|nr:hypothetical protein [Lysinibacillus fusiformis]